MIKAIGYFAIAFGALYVSFVALDYLVWKYNPRFVELREQFEETQIKEAEMLCDIYQENVPDFYRKKVAEGFCK